ncbi:TonB family protein [Altererythrobacter aerius]|uniref:TonB family protein n=1 Tax=Tsuneonella aeria TaxID=1837929 RepID=A0A6I4TGC0_9SPHN|nr:TonB family protein [Tsuneonella aeria]MXO75657.1 TonB family protein [Tsuneonella aeria]
MKTVLTSTLALVLLAMPATTGAQNVARDGLVVSGQPTAKAWVDTMTTKLDRELDHEERRARPGQDQQGIVQLRFTRSADGRPSDVQVIRASSPGALQTSARRAVSRLRGIPEIPQGYAGTQNVHVNIVVAGSEGHMRKLTRQLRQWEAERMARAPGERRVLALNSAR